MPNEGARLFWLSFIALAATGAGGPIFAGFVFAVVVTLAVAIKILGAPTASILGSRGEVSDA